MLPDRVSNPGPLTYESGALPIALRGPAGRLSNSVKKHLILYQDKDSEYKIPAPYLSSAITCSLSSVQNSYRRKLGYYRDIFWLFKTASVDGIMTTLTQW